MCSIECISEPACPSNISMEVSLPREGFEVYKGYGQKGSEEQSIESNREEHGLRVNPQF